MKFSDFLLSDVSILSLVHVFFNDPSSTNGDYGKNIYPCLRYAVFISVPKDIRMERVKNRSFQKFGNRMLPGGDLYEQEEKFFDFARDRTENFVEEWIASLSCPVIRVDGTEPVEENIKLIMEQIQK